MLLSARQNRAAYSLLLVFRREFCGSRARSSHDQEYSLARYSKSEFLSGIQIVLPSRLHFVQKFNNQQYNIR